MEDQLIQAVECCRFQMCENCPLQTEICDDLAVEMVDVPVRLLDMIGMELCALNLTKDEM